MEKTNSEYKSFWQKLKSYFDFDIWGKDEFDETVDFISKTPEYKEKEPYWQSSRKPSACAKRIWLTDKKSSYGAAYREYGVMRRLGAVNKDWEKILAFYQGENYKPAVPLKGKKFPPLWYCNEVVDVFMNEVTIGQKRLVALALRIELEESSIKKELPQKITAQPIPYVQKVSQHIR